MWFEVYEGMRLVTDKYNFITAQDYIQIDLMPQ